MIREYAVDPEGVAALERPVAFLDLFGRGTGRLITGHKAPRKWLREMLHVAREREAKGLLPSSQYRRLEELVRNLSTSTEAVGDRFLPKTDRRRSFDGTLPWIEATLCEHARQAFDAVIADDPRADFTPLDADSLQPKFRVVTALDVPQEAAGFEAALAPLLAVSRRLLLVDPYFDPGKKRYQTLLPLLLGRHPQLEDVELYLKADSTHGPSTASLESDLRRLPLPPGIRIGAWRLRERADGPKLHNRYLLTDVAGVVVDPGLDTSSTPGHTFTLNLMPEGQYRARMEDYGELAGFETVDRLTMTT
ncbi:hypothetical protein [uncultured Deinococcus sp.]|uniref:hypothetical protein n=1 Tax=uncultured Deinococcus sp. TaxID=158789 RepID=UPI002586A10D|nr:hypothetical protein [uncultured Deinococcus sp.]